MGPGPITVDPRVLRAMSAQLVGQYDPAMTQCMNETMALYRGVFKTANQWTLLIDGTSRAGIEAVLISLLEPGDKILVPVFGRFGHLLCEIAERCGVPAVLGEILAGVVIGPSALGWVMVMPLALSSAMYSPSSFSLSAQPRVSAAAAALSTASCVALSSALKSFRFTTVTLRGNQADTG